MAGFNTQLKVVEFATFAQPHRRRRLPGLGADRAVVRQRPRRRTYMSLHSTGNRNVGHYSNPEMDRLMEATRTESDPDRRRELFHQVAQLSRATAR
jgi:peptide/nickel transport system substrate-binding protein